MNKRIMKCGNSVYAIGEENSLADKKEKAYRCQFCDTDLCEYKEEYMKALRKDK